VPAEDCRDGQRTARLAKAQHHVMRADIAALLDVVPGGGMADLVDRSDIGDGRRSLQIHSGIIGPAEGAATHKGTEHWAKAARGCFTDRQRGFGGIGHESSY